MLYIYILDETAGDCEDRVFFILRALNTVKKEIDTSWMRQRIDINIHHNLNKYIFAHAACKYVDDDNNVELHCILVIFGKNYTNLKLMRKLILIIIRSYKKLCPRSFYLHRKLKLW